MDLGPKALDIVSLNEFYENDRLPVRALCINPSLLAQSSLVFGFAHNN